MGIRRWKDHRGRERIYVSKKWPDGTRYRRLVTSLAVAKRRLRRIERSIRRGSWRELRHRLTKPAKETPSPVLNLTIAQLGQIYFKEYCQVQNTRPDYKEHALKPVTRILGAIPLKDFRRGHAHDFIAVRSTEVTAATVNRSLQVLKNMLSFAVDKEYLEAHPLHHFRLLREKKHPLRIMSLAVLAPV